MTHPQETWPQFFTRLANNRKAAIEAETDPAKKADLIMIHAQCSLIDMICGNRVEPESTRVAFASGNGACQVIEHRGAA